MYGFIGQAVVTIGKTVVTMGTNQLNLVTNEHGTPSTDVKLFRNYGCYKDNQNSIRLSACTCINHQIGKRESQDDIRLLEHEAAKWLPADVIVVDALKQQQK